MFLGNLSIVIKFDDSLELLTLPKPRRRTKKCGKYEEKQDMVNGVFSNGNSMENIQETFRLHMI